MTSKNLDIDLLHTFVTVADAGSFSRASELLFFTQPTISLRIKRLEEQTATKLFSRQGQGAVLTEEGLHLLRYARRLVSLNDEAWTAITSPGISGPVRLGLLPDFSVQSICKVIYGFAKAHPGVRLEIMEGPSVELREALEDGRLDLALLIGEESKTSPLFRKEQICWLASPDYQWDKKRPLPLALCPQPCRFREMAFSQLESAGIEWQMTFTSQNFLVTKEAVVAGLGVTVRGESLIDESIVRCEKKLGLPELPIMDIVLERAKKSLNLESVNALADMMLMKNRALSMEL
ncbi:LysR substrate-binding domain-containing protein [Aurantivibrio infirmus]